MRDVAFSCDNNGVPFLKVAVGSLLKHYRGAEPLRVNVFEGYGGHSAENKSKLKSIVDGWNEKVKVKGEGEQRIGSPSISGEYAASPVDATPSSRQKRIEPSTVDLDLQPPPLTSRSTSTSDFDFFSLRYVNVEKTLKPYEDAILHRDNSRWNVFTWTPVFTPALIPDATGNVIHFDIDMLFNADVSELFEMDLRSHLIACTYEYDRYGANAGRVIWEKGILPPSVERYFNTGVLVFNAEACRAERTWEKIVDWYRAHYDIADRIEQDAWNALYWDRMRPLPVAWNFHDRAMKNYAKWDLSAKYWLGNPPADCLRAALAPKLLHFWGPKKPWKVSHRPYRKLYHAAMRDVGLTPPREPILAPWYDFVNARIRRRLERRLESV